MGATKRLKPRGCKGHYIPWVCGTCDLKKECKPRELAKYEKSRV